MRVARRLTARELAKLQLGHGFGAREQATQRVERIDVALEGLRHRLQLDVGAPLELGLELPLLPRACGGVERDHENEGGRHRHRDRGPAAPTDAPVGPDQREGREHDDADRVAGPPGEPAEGKCVAIEKTAREQSADSNSGADRAAQRAAKQDQPEVPPPRSRALGAGEPVDQAGADERLRRGAGGDCEGYDQQGQQRRVTGGPDCRP